MKCGLILKKYEITGKYLLSSRGNTRTQITTGYHQIKAIPVKKKHRVSLSFFQGIMCPYRMRCAGSEEEDVVTIDENTACPKGFMQTVVSTLGYIPVVLSSPSFRHV